MFKLRLFRRLGSYAIRPLIVQIRLPAENIPLK
jgi:hypothetical protein